jgi:FtsH-binding integral membrane protein
MGGIAQSILSHIIPIVYPSTAIDIQKTINSTSIPQNILEMKNNIYGTLLFYRHLCISIILLGISLIIWFEENLNKMRTFCVTALIFFIIGLAYYFTRQDFVSISDAINKRFAP